MLGVMLGGERTYEYWISHGTAATLRIAQMNAPRRLLMYLGNHKLRSFEKLTLLAEMFVPMTAKAQHSPAKNIAARFSQNGKIARFSLVAKSAERARYRHHSFS